MLKKQGDEMILLCLSIRYIAEPRPMKDRTLVLKFGNLGRNKK